MGQWTIAKRLWVGFSLVLAVTVALGTFAWMSIHRIDEYSAAVTDDSVPGLYQLGKIGNLTRENQLLVMQHVTSTDTAEMATVDQQLTAKAQEITKTLDTYERTIVRDSDRQLFAAVKESRAEYVRVRDAEVLPLSRALKTDEAIAAVKARLNPAYDKYRAAVESEIEDNKRAADLNSAGVDSTTAAATLGTLIGLVIALGVGGLVAYTIVRTTSAVLRQSVTELSDGAQQVASAAGQVSGASQSLSQGSSEQAASLEETSASMEEMASMTRKNAENSQQAAAMMLETERQVNGANAALADMVSSMAAIKESSDKVSKIIKTIDEIAFQTNILALNAAVEAARAGEAGMGFAVVAEEVRALAQRSARAAKDTADLIEAAITSSDEGNAKVSQVSGAITAITQTTAKAKALVDEVSVASQQQSQGIDQVAQAVAQMEKVTQGTAATAEESAAASEELNAQAEASMAVVGRLSALVGMSAEGAAPRTVRRTTPAAKSTPAQVIAMPKASRTRQAASAEEQIPLGDTGTYGSF